MNSPNADPPQSAGWSAPAARALQPDHPRWLGGLPRLYWPYLMTLACLAGAGLALFADLTVAKWFDGWDLPRDLRGILETGERFGHGLGVLFVLIAIAVLDRAKRPCLPRIVACAYGAGLTASGLKLLIARNRPLALPLDAPQAGQFVAWLPANKAALADQFGYAIQSFPSGHSATACGLAIGLTWLYPQGKWLFATLAVLTMMQRVSCGAHFLSDTLVGAALAFLIAGSFVDPRILGWGFDRQQCKIEALQARLRGPAPT